MLPLETKLLNTDYRPKLKFFGHIKRHDSLENATLERQVPGNRSISRPRRRWEDWEISKGSRYVSSECVCCYVLKGICNYSTFTN